jgi:murein DD-endopeptidase MepM/ murein hydrolase activator NlpD
MKIVVKSRKGKIPRKAAVALRVKKTRFPTEELSLPAQFDRFDKATLQRIRKERDRLDQIWARTTARRWWRGRFIPPVPGGITSSFGRRRVINGSPRSPHGGVDLKAPQGAEVVAANDGLVVIRDDFFFSGKSIVLDHGGGLYTAYFHLEDFRVKMKSQVNKGEVIGWAGMTGRVTGPHLHWGVRLGSARVDPFELLKVVSPME